MNETFCFDIPVVSPAVTITAHVNQPLRFWLFSGSSYYSSPGLCDLIGRYASVDDALAELHALVTSYRRDLSWYQIVDTDHLTPRVVRHRVSNSFGASTDEYGIVQYVIPHDVEDADDSVIHPA